MRKTILAFIFMLVSAIGAFGQSTTVSGTVTDAGSQAWASGTYQFTFQPNPQFPTGPYTWTGGTLNSVISGSLDGSGHYSVSIPSNSAITPAGSTWIIKFTPNATSQSFSTPRTTITGGTQTLNATPPAILISWSLPPGPAISAYSDAEIGGTLVPGSEYFNTTTLLTRVWNGSAWSNQGSGSGGGGVCPAGAATQIQFTDGTNCVGDPNFTWDTSTGSLLAQGTGAFSGLFSGPSFLNFVQVTPAVVNLFATESGGTVDVAADAGIGFGTNTGNVNFSALAGNIVLAASGVTEFTSTNMNLASNSELDLGGTAVGIGSGILGLNGSTSGKCTLGGDATGSSVASNCSVSILSDGVHSGAIALIGNTTVPVGFPLANTVDLLGPNSASFSGYALQWPSTAPTAGQAIVFGTPSSGIIPITFVGGGGFVSLTPTTTAANTIAPTANGVTALTLTATSGTGSPDVLDIFSQFGVQELGFSPFGSLTVRGAFGCLAQGCHIDPFAAANDLSNTLTITSATSASANFTNAYNSAPSCVAVPTADPTTTGVYWVTTTTGAITINQTISGTMTYNYHCMGAPF